MELAGNYGGGVVADKYLISIAYLSLLVTSGTFHVNSFIFMRSYLWRIMTGNIWRTQKSEIADDGGSLMATTARHSINTLERNVRVELKMQLN